MEHEPHAQHRYGQASANPIVSAVQHIRTVQADLTPRQRDIRDAHLRQVDALVASGAFSLAPRV
ncbi:hypothetical protein [Agromyces sp. ZXT2-3]|uniref:hypothetical protein n=1 Tax=Agromyces sp. ZXT2-3 TaxID=3461152 RepID=UPI004054BC20